MTAVGGLGRVFDIAPVITPVDLADGANTGNFVKLQNAEGVAFVVYLDAGTAGEAPTVVVRSSDGSTPADLDVVTQYYVKEEATLDNDETWTKVTQDAGDITDADWDDANQVLLVFEIEAGDLPDGHDRVSVNIADPGTAHIGAVLAILYSLNVQRAPENLAALV